MASKNRGDGLARKQLRKHWAAAIKANGAWPCWRCGRLIIAGEPFIVGHIVDHMDGGETTVANTAPEHPKCGYSAGGRRGAEVTWKKKYPKRQPGKSTKPIEWI